MAALRPAFLVLVFLLLVACGRNETPLATGEQAQIACSEECSDRGQCGTLNDGRRAVLGGEFGPAVSGHTRFFLDETLVTIAEIQQRDLIAARDGVALTTEATAFPHLFYRVEGEGKSAWVSEWCVARP